MSVVKVGSAAAALALVSGSAVQAAEVVNLPLSQLLGNGQSMTATFNLSSFLTPAAGGNFRVTGAALTVQGYSPYGQTGTAYAGYGYSQPYTYYYSYSCGFAGWSSCGGSYTYYTFVPVYTAVDSYVDNLTIASGAATAVGSTQRDSSYAGNYYGDLVASFNVNANALSGLNSNGLLSFTALANTNSSITVSNATLTFDLERVSTAVPEPATWAMLILGMGAVGASMRRARSRRKSVALI